MGVSVGPADATIGGYNAYVQSTGGFLKSVAGVGNGTMRDNIPLLLAAQGKLINVLLEAEAQRNPELWKRTLAFA